MATFTGNILLTSYFTVKLFGWATSACLQICSGKRWSKGLVWFSRRRHLLLKPVENFWFLEQNGHVVCIQKNPDRIQSNRKPDLSNGYPLLRNQICTGWMVGLSFCHFCLSALSPPFWSQDWKTGNFILKDLTGSLCFAYVFLFMLKGEILHTDNKTSLRRALPCDNHIWHAVRSNFIFLKRPGSVFSCVKC